MLCALCANPNPEFRFSRAAEQFLSNYPAEPAAPETWKLPGMLRRPPLSRKPAPREDVMVCELMLVEVYLKLRKTILPFGV